MVIELVGSIMFGYLINVIGVTMSEIKYQKSYTERTRRICRNSYASLQPLSNACRLTKISHTN